jgi:hypothetical protein
MVRSSVGGGVLHRLVKPLDGDGATPVLAGLVGRAARCLLFGAAAMVSVELEDLQGPICNFSFS